MKKIVLLSDTHGYIDEQMLTYIKQADEVWHAGDIGDLIVTDTILKHRDLRAVYGNIDGRDARNQFAENNRFTLEGVSVWITHIGGYPGRYDRHVYNELRRNPPKIFIAGHSHILKIIYDKKNKLLYLNPGAAGKSGFHKVRTMLRFELNVGNIENMEIIELEKRG